MTTSLPSVMGHQFSRVPSVQIPRSLFNRSHGLKTTFDAGYMVPIFVDEVLPGDTFNLKMSLFGRLATPLHPFMDNLRLDVFWFFVPTRLVWDNWEKLNGAQDNPGDTTDYVMPTITAPAGGFAENSVYDYLGIPTKIDGLVIQAGPLRAHNLVFNEWVRDQNLQQSLPVSKGDGPDDPTSYKLFKRGKRHDYFTGCLPWPQKGTEVTLPIGGTAPIVGQSPVTGLGVTEIPSTAGPINVKDSYKSIPSYSNYFSGADIRIEDPDGDNWPGVHVDFDDSRNLAEVDLTSVTAITIRDFREAVAAQQIYEQDARGGTRYTEIIRSHFGVISPDMRLQRPEYLGGGTHNITVNPIAQTSSTDATTPQGNLAAMATSAGRTGFVQSFTEHGYILGYVCLRADLNYQQGLNRMWSRSTRFDHYWPGLAQLSEQAVLSKEIYVDGTAADDDVFGYQERYAEYRYKPSLVTSRFRSNATQPLDTWHLALDFEERPVLNDVFIEEDPPVDRVIAVISEPHMILDTYVDLKCARPMPLYGVPGLSRL